MSQLKNKFLSGMQFDTDEQGRLKIYSDEQMNYFQAEREAKTKIDEINRKKLQIYQETEAELATYAKDKQIFERAAFTGQVAQAVVDPRMWAKGIVGLGKMLSAQTRENFVTGSQAISESESARQLFKQSQDLANKANEIVKTDKTQAESLLRQSQALFDEGTKLQSGEANTKLGELTATKIAAKSIGSGLEVASLLPVSGAVAGTGKLIKAVDATADTAKLGGKANLVSNLLGLGDIYAGVGSTIKAGVNKQGIKATIGMAGRNTLQAPLLGTTQALGDNEEDSFENIKNSITTTAQGILVLSLGFGFAGQALSGAISNSLVKKAQNTPAEPVSPTPTTKTSDTRKAELERAKNMGLIGEKPETPTAQIEPVKDQNQNPIQQSLGAFDPKTDIPMVDLTNTIKGNNIDFNPDSVMSINSTRKAIDELAMLSGMQVGGKAIKIDKNDPKYKEVFETMIKPLTDGINEVDGNTLSKIPIEEVELKLNEIKTTLENQGFNVIPEKIVDTPALDAVDNKLAKGEPILAEESEAAIKELVENTGDPEINVAVKQEVNAKLKESRLYARFKEDNPNIVDPNKAVLYEASVEKENLDFANNLVTNDFDEALRISNSISNKGEISPKETAVAFATVDKLKELGRNEEIGDIMANISQKGSKSGAFIQSLSTLGKTDPKKYILEATQARQAKFSQEIKTNLEQVKKELNNVVIDKDTIISILDNITCR
jgi:hypothetical protein